MKGPKIKAAKHICDVPTGTLLINEATGNHMIFVLGKDEKRDGRVSFVEYHILGYNFLSIDRWWRYEAAGWKVL